MQKLGEESDLIARYEQLRLSALGMGKDINSPLGRIGGLTPSGLSPMRRGLLDDNEPDVECPAETADWMHSVMASMQKKPGKSLLVPIAPADEAVEQSDFQKPSKDPQLSREVSPTITPRRQTSEEQTTAAKRGPAATERGLVSTEMEDVIKRMGGQQGYSANEIARLRSTYNRFKVPDAPDVHKDDLVPILQRLGFMMIDAEEVKRIVEEVTVYSTLDFNEFVQFVGSYSQFERGKFQEMFDSFDDDKSGQLSAGEVEKLMSAIGFTPLKSMIIEALELVDADGSGQLNFEEFLFLLATYRKSEGFNKKEMENLQLAFEMEASAGTNEVPAAKLKDVLLRFFGPQSIKHLGQLEEEAVSGAKKKEDNDDDEPPPPLHLHDVMIFARRLREVEFKEYQDEFKKQDKDNSGSIDLDELQGIISGLGFTLPGKTIKEFSSLVDTDLSVGDGHDSKKDGTLDYDEFVNLMVYLRDTDGFSKDEMNDFKSTFLRFDDNNSDDVDVLEMGDMMRYMGYLTKLDDIQVMISKVDFNGSGALDFREFVRLMRLCREEECAKMREAFKGHKDKASGMLPAARIEVALMECQDGTEGKQGDKNQQKIDMEFPKNDVDFDGFMLVVDGTRKVRVAESRKRAGFSPSEVTRFRKLFDFYDKDHSDTIDAKEVVQVLTQMGFKMGTKEERNKMMEQLDQARDSAKHVGVVDVGEMGSGPVNFWVFIQLLRVLYNRDDKRVLDRETAAAEQSRFSPQEVEEFREVFLSWWAHEKTFEEEPTEEELLDLAAEPDLKEISKDGMRRLLKSMGVRLTEKDRGELENHVMEFGDSHHKVDFAAFLRIMRWMLDANFADINKVVGSRAK
jgi:Ca2+-binding EF-hand superfamily protein